VAGHAERRDRYAVYDALERREVDGTSGPRILLWVDLLNAPAAPAPMGSEVTLAEVPSFEVRAAGSFEQKPGCPPETLAALPAARVESLCLGECYHPGDRRVPIEAIEVVRIRPRPTPDAADASHAEPVEAVAARIEDPWLRLPCPADGSGCRVTFSDPDFPARGNDTIYYVRALQVETPAINGDGVRARREGDRTRVRPCSGGYATDPADDCLAPVRERAWSSPIFVDHGAQAGEGNTR
jgi:hypothetical protein